VNDRHPVEILLNADANDILNAIQRGFRALVDVKGKLAEYFLEKKLADLVKTGVISGYDWIDADGKPDFLLHFGKRELILECKYIRSGEMFRSPPGKAT
jgi:hypothetical protein